MTEEQGDIVEADSTNPQIPSQGCAIAEPIGAILGSIAGVFIGMAIVNAVSKCDPWVKVVAWSSVPMLYIALMIGGSICGCFLWLKFNEKFRRR